MRNTIHMQSSANKEDENILKTKRIELRLTQKEVAQKAGISMLQYQRFEIGGRKLSNASFMNACKILTALDIDFNQYFKQELENENYNQNVGVKQKND